MRARLVALEGQADICLDRPLTLIGRHRGCDVRVNSPQVSRYHCCLAWFDGEIEVRDLGSTNGIKINGHRLESGRLRPGDELSIARLRFLLIVGSTPSGPEPAPSPGAAPGPDLDPPTPAPAAAYNPDAFRVLHGDLGLRPPPRSL